MTYPNLSVVELENFSDYLKMFPLLQKFYQRDTTQVARELLGKQLFHLRDGKLAGGTITETSPPRVGIDYAGEAKKWQLRFFVRL